MKVFQVTYEEDGESRKECHKHVTDINKVNTFYSAKDIEELLAGIEELRADPERTIVAIAEVISALWPVTVINERN